MDCQDMGLRIRNARRAMGLTQEELADQLGISSSFLGHLERGTRVASLETLVALCNTLQVTPEHLLAASLNVSALRTPAGLSPKERTTLTHFLRLAEDAVRGWDD